MGKNIEIKEEVKIGDMILEKGDRIRILKESGDLKQAIYDIRRSVSSEMGSGPVDHYAGERFGEDLIDIIELVCEEPMDFAESVFSAMEEYMS